MANKKVQIQIDTKANTAGATQAAQSLQSVDKAAQSVNGKINTTSASTSKLGGIAGQAGFQIQDFAVQVGAGTSALTAFSQQAPQLLGAFGPTGAIAGAIVAVGAVASKVFLGMMDNAEDAGKAMEEIAEKLKETFQTQGKKAIDEFNASIERTTALSIGMRDAELAVADAQRTREQASAKLIDSQLKLDEAQIKYLASTGQIKNEEQALAEVRAKAAEATKQAEIAAVQGQVDSARQQYLNILAQRDDVQSEVDRAQKRMAELEARQSGLQAFRAASRESDARFAKTTGQKDFVSPQTTAASAELTAIEKQIAELYSIIQGAPQRLQQITDKASAEMISLTTLMDQAETQITTIESQADLSQKAQEITAATEKIGQSAQDIEKAIGGFEPVTQAQAKAKESIMQAVSDGVITAQEQQQIGTQLQVLMSSLQMGQTSLLSTLQQLIELNNKMALQMSKLQPQVQKAKNSLLIQ